MTMQGRLTYGGLIWVNWVNWVNYNFFIFRLILKDSQVLTFHSENVVIFISRSMNHMHKRMVWGVKEGRKRPEAAHPMGNHP
jgi:hypothetical protein